MTFPDETVLLFIFEGKRLNKIRLQLSYFTKTDLSRFLCVCLSKCVQKELL